MDCCPHNLFSHSRLSPPRQRKRGSPHDEIKKSRKHPSISKERKEGAEGDGAMRAERGEGGESSMGELFVRSESLFLRERGGVWIRMG